MATRNINFDQPLQGNLPTSLTVLKADPAFAWDITPRELHARAPKKTHPRQCGIRLHQPALGDLRAGPEPGESYATVKKNQLDLHVMTWNEHQDIFLLEPKMSWNRIFREMTLINTYS